MYSRFASLLLTLYFFNFVSLGLTQSLPLPDFQVTADSFSFSNNSPVDGQEISIFIDVINIGPGAPTLNEDLILNLYEGESKNSSIQIMCRQVIIGLEPGETKRFIARWRIPVGQTKIHAEVNPTSHKKYIPESSQDNNYASTTITAKPRVFPTASTDKIHTAIQRGVDWIKLQQGRHSRTCLQCGTENQLILSCVICGATLKGLPEDQKPGPAWDFGEESRQETAIALLALISARKALGQSPLDDQAIQKGLGFLVAADWNQFEVYQYAIIVPTLVATGDAKYRQLAQFAIDQIVKKQLPVGGDEFSDPRDDGGWGYGSTADGAHMNMVVYALYAAKQWGLNVPPKTWKKAEAWIRRNQTNTGGWLYNLVDSGSPWADGVYGSMTATGLWALRACSVPVEDQQIQKGLDWIRRYWTLTRNPGSTAWHYYYLVALQRFCDIPPKLDQLVGHNWYQEIANMLVSEQQSNGRWIDHQDYFPTTCFALLFLSRSLPVAIKPDLGVIPQTLRFSPPSPRVGEPMQISVTICNNGASTQGVTNIDFYAGKTKKRSQRIARQKVILTPNRNQTSVSIDWVARVEGQQLISVFVDPDNLFNDLNPDNNQDFTIINIRRKSAQAIDPNLAIKKVSSNLYRIGTVMVNVAEGTVSIPGQINIVSPSTILEFFACTKLGKTHESLIMVEAEPIHIQLGLLRLNMTPGMNLTAQGDPHRPMGDEAHVWIDWKRGKEVIRLSAEDLVWNAFTNRKMLKTNWVFTGARIRNNQFTAQVSQSIIALHRDPDTIINHPLPSGIDDQTFRVNSTTVPAKNTPVTLIIQRTTSRPTKS